MNNFYLNIMYIIMILIMVLLLIVIIRRCCAISSNNYEQDQYLLTVSNQNHAQTQQVFTVRFPIQTDYLDLMKSRINQAKTIQISNSSTNVNLNDECCICMEYVNNVKLKPCKHKFCGKCILKCINNRDTLCPCCRIPYYDLNIII